MLQTNRLYINVIYLRSLASFNEGGGNIKTPALSRYKEYNSMIQHKPLD